MTLVAALDQLPLDGVLRYVTAEQSFTFDVASPVDLQVRSGSAGVTSLSVGTLQIEIGIATGLVLFVWGLHPQGSWRLQPVGRPNPVMSGARLETAVPLQRGVSLQLAAVGSWTTAFDETTGWLRVTKDFNRQSADEFLIASGIALGVTDGALDALWLQPVFD